MINSFYWLEHDLREKQHGAPQAPFGQWSSALAAAVLAFGLVGCLSDVPIPPCLSSSNGCGGSHGGVGSAVGGESGESGEGGENLAGDAGSGVLSAGKGGEARGGAGSGAGVGGGAAGSGAGVGGGAAGSSGGNVSGAGTSGAAGGEPVVPGGLIVPQTLPAPCGTNAYSQVLGVGAGTPPYSWQLVPSVDGWHIALDPTKTDGSRAMLTAEHPGASQISVDVTDAAGRHVTQTYAVTPRTACWFAYTALDADGPQIHVLDPILALPPPLLPAHNQGVYDFAFSPDGHYLAYRFGADASHPNGRHLALIDVDPLAWGEQLLSFSEDAVTAYAWAPDSSVLAVAFDQSAVSYLGGYRVAVGTQPVELVPSSIVIASALYWIGAGHVAWYASGTSDPVDPNQLDPDPNEVTAFYAALGVTGFQSPVLSTDTFYDVPVAVQPSDDGFFMISPGHDPIPEPFLEFNWLGGSIPHVTTLGDKFVAPSGQFAAAVTNTHQLSIYRARDGVQVTTSTLTELCPKFLTWAKGAERMACVADVPPDPQGTSHSEVRIFDLDAANNLSMSVVKGYCTKNAASLSASSQCAPQEYDYSEASATAQPRVFSSSGDYLAFTTGSASAVNNFVYWADLRGVPPFALKGEDAGAFGDTVSVSPTHVAFSPNGHFIVRQLGNYLSLYASDSTVQQGETAALLDIFADPAEANLSCSEDFAGVPDRWCGSAIRNVPFTWAANSLALAYRSLDARTSDQTLTVADLTPFPTVESARFPAADCAGKCSGQVAFQPNPK